MYLWSLCLTHLSDYKLSVVGIEHIDETTQKLWKIELKLQLLMVEPA